MLHIDSTKKYVDPNKRVTGRSTGVLGTGGEATCKEDEPSTISSRFSVDDFRNQRIKKQEYKDM